jgi:hypothetical protein
LLLADLSVVDTVALQTKQGFKDVNSAFSKAIKFLKIAENAHYH